MPSLVPSATPTAASSKIFKATGGALHSLSCTSGGDGYVMVFDSPTVPADGTVSPVYCWKIAANTSIAINFEPNPLRCLTGISIAISSTGPFSKTTSPTGHIVAQFE